MSETKGKITLVKGKFTNKYWLKNLRNERLTPNFVLEGEDHIGQFVWLDTDKGTIIYNECREQILYRDRDDSVVMELAMLTDKLYYIRVNLDSFGKYYQFYSPEGKEQFCSSIITEICDMGQGIIAIKDMFQDWGIIDKDLNWLAPHKYEEVFGHVKNGHIIACLDNTTDIITIDEIGSVQIVTIDGLFVKYLSPNLILVTSNKKYGVTSIMGQTIIPIAFDEIEIVKKGEKEYFIIKCNTLYGLLDKQGNILRECEYYQIVAKDGKLIAVTRKIVETTEEISV